MIGMQVGAVSFVDEGVNKVLDAFRGSGALPWGQHHHRLFHGTEKLFRPGYKAYLTTAWLPALDGVLRSS